MPYSKQVPGDRHALAHDWKAPEVRSTGETKKARLPSALGILSAKPENNRSLPPNSARSALSQETAAQNAEQRDALFDEILGADDPLAAYGLALEQGTTASWYSETLHRHAGTVAYPHPVSAARFIIQIERYPQTFVYNFVRAMPEFGAVSSSFLSP